jgi:murein DD-endopeptidase MepM/ murein hydrolase activator NlpD
VIVPPRLALVRTRLPRLLHRLDGRSWLSQGVAALAISALGLAVAGSVAGTSQADVAGGTDRSSGQSSTVRSADRSQVSSGTPSRGGARTTPPGPLGPSASTSTASSPSFGQVSEKESRTARMRSAVVKERAAQRAEALAVTAERVSRAASTEAARARQAGLTATERATRERAAALAWEREQKAIAQRVAAEARRLAAEQERAAVQTAALSSTTAFDLPDTPPGSGGASPVPGAVIGAHFGQYGLWARYHTGLDFRAGFGTPIRAVVAGVVVYAGNAGNWAGNHVAIRHAGGYTTMSSHMSSMTVSAGQQVEAGQVIGFVGQTGRAFGAHLHFEVYPPGAQHGDVYQAVNPVPWLNQHGVSTR